MAFIDIQIKKGTVNKLRKLANSLESYDEIINRLIKGKQTAKEILDYVKLHCEDIEFIYQLEGELKNKYGVK